VLGVATFASVRSANRAARAAEGSLLAGLRPAGAVTPPGPPREGLVRRPALAPHRRRPRRHRGDQRGDLPGHVTAQRRHRHRYPARLGVLPRTAQRRCRPPRSRSLSAAHARHLCAGGGHRFLDERIPRPGVRRIRTGAQAIAARQALTIDLLYGDFEGGQCSVTRFGLLPVGEDGWLTAAGRHWNIDRPQPR